MMPRVVATIATKMTTISSTNLAFFRHLRISRKSCWQVEHTWYTLKLSNWPPCSSQKYFLHPPSFRGKLHGLRHSHFPKARYLQSFFSQKPTKALLLFSIESCLLVSNFTFVSTAMFFWIMSSLVTSGVPVPPISLCFPGEGTLLSSLSFLYKLEYPPS